jgi:uncharacterized protein (DUF433 family)
MVLDTSLVGVGLYTIGEASRLTGVPAQRIRRWLRGYHYQRGGQRLWSAPLWHPQIERIDDEVTLGFRDLTEVRIVDALIHAGLGLRTIRLAMDRARAYLSDERPFSTTRFKTDGRSIFLEIADEAGESTLYDLLRRQYGFGRIIAPSLKDLDFDEHAAVRWWPLSHRHAVVLDPQRGFGQPIVNDGGVSTSVLAAAVEAEGSVRAAAKTYNVGESAVRDALLFEKRLAA